MPPIFRMKFQTLSKMNQVQNASTPKSRLKFLKKLLHKPTLNKDDFLTSFLACLLASFLPDLLSYSLTDSLIDWLTDWLTDRPTDRPTDWLTDWLILPVLLRYAKPSSTFMILKIAPETYTNLIYSRWTNTTHITYRAMCIALVLVFLKMWKFWSLLCSRLN